MPPLSKQDLHRTEAGQVKFPSAAPERPKGNIPGPETEKSLEKIVSGGSETPSSGQTAGRIVPAPDNQSSGLAATAEKERLEQIEKILSDGLLEIYAQLDSDQQKVFKERGEETAAKINLLFKKAKVKIGEIISLIRKWLMVIPGVNRFFVEQEAKIKADEIIRLTEI